MTALRDLTEPRGKVMLMGVDLELSGCGRFLVDLSSGLRQLGWDASLFVMRGGPLLAELERRGVPVVVAVPKANAGAGGLRLGAVSASALTRELRRFRPDVLHTNLFGADLIGRMVALGARVPVVVSTQHDAKRRAWGVTALRRITAGRSQATIACSSSVADYCREVLHVAADRLFTIDNGVAVDRFSGIARHGAERVTVLAMGPLSPPKGHAALIDAFRHVVIEIPHAKLVIAGDGPLRAQLEARVALHGLEDAVELRSATPHVEVLLADADVFVQPSITEGLSLAMLEAMASGLPVVATDIPANARVLDSGRYGVLVPPDDSEELARAIVRTMRSPEAAELGYRARRQVRECYSLDRMVARYGALYEDLLS